MANNNELKIFDERKLYDQPAFTAAGLGSKTKFWEYIREKRFRVVKIGRLTKVSGSELNRFVNSLST